MLPMASGMPAIPSRAQIRPLLPLSDPKHTCTLVSVLHTALRSPAVCAAAATAGAAAAVAANADWCREPPESSESFVRAAQRPAIGHLTVRPSPSCQFGLRMELRYTVVHLIRMHFFVVAFLVG